MALLTKSQQAERYIRNAIASGRWSPGEALTPERQLLSELGISRTTLRDALNALANEGIIVRKSGSGTYVSHVPTSNTVALVFHSETLSSPMGYFYRTMAEAARRFIEEAGYRAVLAVGQGGTISEFANSVNLFDKHVLDNTIGVMSFYTMGPLESKLADAGVFSVTVDHIVPASQYSIVMDYAQMSKMAVEALKTNGIDDFALMTWDIPDDSLLERKIKEQRRIEMEAVGGRVDRLIKVKHDMSACHAYSTFKEWWAKSDHPNAVFFFDDALCEVSTRAMLEMGIQVPDDLAIITDLNVGRNMHFSVPLTGVGWDPVQLVREAWVMLRNLIHGIDVDCPVVYVPPVMLKGRSLGEPESTEQSDTRLEYANT